MLVALTASNNGQPLGISGLLENPKTLLPMAAAAVTGLVNMVVLRPLTVNTMRERKHQGKIISLIPIGKRADLVSQKPVMARRVTTPLPTLRRW